ncbi:MAG: N-acetylmuramate alpha-1-phosphate uridylyltransferase MurU [Lautropia sp.]
MKVMLLAAGRGERMRPLTDTCPKPLLIAGGKPLIVHHIERLARAGHREIVVNHAWLGAMLEAALGDGSRHGVSIRYSAEREALETAGGIAKALPLLRADTPPDAIDAPFLVVSADVYTDFDFAAAEAIAARMDARSLRAWCVMVANPPHHPHGDFLLDGELLRLHGADASPRARGLTYAGIGVFRPSLFDAIVPGTRHALRPVLEREITAARVGGEYHSSRWFDIGTPERLAELDRLLAQPGPTR